MVEVMVVSTVEQLAVVLAVLKGYYSAVLLVELTGYH